MTRVLLDPVDQPPELDSQLLSFFYILEQIISGIPNEFMFMISSISVSFRCKLPANN